MISWFPIQLTLVNLAPMQQQYQHESNDDSDQITAENLIFWFPIAIFVPQLILQKFNLIRETRLPVKKNITIGIIFEHFVMVTFSIVRLVVEEDNHIFFTAMVLMMVIISTIQYLVQMNLANVVAILPNGYQKTILNSYYTASIIVAIYALIIAPIHLKIDETIFKGSDAVWFHIIWRLTISVPLTLIGIKYSNRLTNNKMYQFYVKQFQ